MSEDKIVRRYTFTDNETGEQWVGEFTIDVDKLVDMLARRAKWRYTLARRRNPDKKAPKRRATSAGGAISLKEAQP